MATSDDIARRIAERVAPRTDPALPAHVQRALAEGDDDDDGPPRPPVLVARLASFVVSVAELTWSIFKDERDRAERRAAEAKPAAPLGGSGELARPNPSFRGVSGGPHPTVEVAHLRRLVEGRLATAVDVPRSVPPEVRVAVLEVAAEEAVAAGRRSPAR